MVKYVTNLLSEIVISMRVFSAVNRKIKFREKDYVDINYIREDGKAVIPIELKTLDELYMHHDYEKLILSDDIYNYIKEVASIIPFKYDIVLEFHCPPIDVETQDRIRRIIKNNYGMEIDDLDYESRWENYISIALFIIGTLFLLIGYALPDYTWSIIKEMVSIVGWVILWDMMETIFFTSNKRRLERLNNIQIYDSQVEFIFDKGWDNK